MNMTKGVRKLRGRLHLPVELVRNLIGLPEEVEIIRVEFDSERELIEFTIKSDTQIREVTFPTPEGGNIPSVNIDTYVGMIQQKDFETYERIAKSLVPVEESEEK